MNEFCTNNYYVIQVKTQGENKFIQQVQKMFPNLKLHFPQRVLDIYKRGNTSPSKHPVFPGYVFMELDADESPYQYLLSFRKTEEFYQFLKSNRDIMPLGNKDLEIVLHFIRRPGAVAEKSKVYFDENSRIVVLSGPLFGLEGKIVKVDRRKKRAKIALDLCENNICIDLAFDVMDMAQRQSA